MDKENKTASLEEQFTEANRNEKISEVFNSLGTAIREFTNSLDETASREIINRFKTVYNIAKQNKQFFTEKQWQVVKDKADFMARQVKKREKAIQETLPSPKSKPVIEEDVSREIILSSRNALNVGKELANSEKNFSECLEFAKEWLRFYENSPYVSELTVQEFTTVIMNACMKERLSDRFVWLWYGEPEIINPSTPWKNYTEVLDGSGGFILTDEELQEYRSQLKKWEKGLLDEKVLKSYLTSSLDEKNS